MPLTVIQALPALNVGGVERGTLEVAEALVSNGHQSIVISAGGRLVPELIRTGSTHIELPIGKKSLLSLKYVSTIQQLLRDHKADILHVRSRLPAWLTYLAWRRMEPPLRPRFVTTVHGPYSVNPYSKIMVRGEKVIAISEFIQNYIFENYPDIDQQKVALIQRGVSAGRFPYGYRANETWYQNWNLQYPQLHGKFLIVLPARITRWKGQEDFIQIIYGLRKIGLNVRGIVVGGAEQKQSFFEELKRMTAQYGLENIITFTGHRDDMREIMSISNVVLSLAKEPEAFGRTALEALSMGVPVVAYNHGGASEVLQEIFPEGSIKPHDINAAIYQIKHFYQTPPHVPRQNPFTLQSMLDKTLNLYKSLANT